MLFRSGGSSGGLGWTETGAAGAVVLAGAAGAVLLVRRRRRRVLTVTDPLD